MKKIAIFLLSVVALFSVSFCSATNQDVGTKAPIYFADQNFEVIATSDIQAVTIVNYVPAAAVINSQAVVKYTLQADAYAQLAETIEPWRMRSREASLINLAINYHSKSPGDLLSGFSRRVDHYLNC